MISRYTHAKSENAMASPKTIANHRTEIAGKLFGLFRKSDGMVYASDKCKNYVKNEDNPMFFKDICLKFQFPNGMDKQYFNHHSEGIKIRQFVFVIKAMKYASELNVKLSLNEVYYYILNCKETLSSNYSPNEIVDSIISDRRKGVLNQVPGGSYDMQHLTEQINLLVLSNLVRLENDYLSLNLKENVAISYFLSIDHSDLPVILKSNSDESKRAFLYEWQEYYTSVSYSGLEDLQTPNDALEPSASTITDSATSDKSSGQNIASDKVESDPDLGDLGENLIYNYERNRIQKSDSRLAIKVQAVGARRGLGYDIQSVYGQENLSKREFHKYIEVKSTKRVTPPTSLDSDWMDTVTMTRNEWVAAEQYGENYFIYRVIFSTAGPFVHVIHNPYKKNEEGSIQAIPTNYRVDIFKDSIQPIITNEQVYEVIGAT
jgi:hypothetical protein